MEILVIVIIINAILSIIPARIAKVKGYSAFWFWVLSLIITFVFGLVITIRIVDKYSYNYRVKPSKSHSNRSNNKAYSNNIQEGGKFHYMHCPSCGYRMGGKIGQCPNCGLLESIYQLHDHPDTIHYCHRVHYNDITPAQCYNTRRGPQGQQCVGCVYYL